MKKGQGIAPYKLEVKAKFDLDNIQLAQHVFTSQQIK